MQPVSMTCGTDLATILRQREGQAAFDKPWELRIFAVAVAACNAGEFGWDEFQEALTDAIRHWEAANPDFSSEDWNYYEHFVTALEVVLARHDRLSTDNLDDRARTILDTPPHKHHVARYDPITVDAAAI
ncbi:nitrile hydratase accessory protein (plasmid) [Tistrella bauzanensis]|uniref:nitrile hydratase accessory protein n=1 Tax=Tistrella TaxID=171436 RepID=UPI0031F64BC6